ncbi:CLUMA_CG007222, isoform A [Clunio marinus]|uniref:CLUMA_CG007222, isoform A n=1 Tax=Clunio marinus TaxID=568069 RepID=A0A1J1I499_9DIPT|nr:CLUMA_CG007222, isoform A [Clunio marinus]
MLQKKHILTVLSIILIVDSTVAIWCYRCNSATPGCSDNFNWKGIGYLGDPCPEDDDICVKIVERKGASETITRDCLSALVPYRTDIPADKYEGCRKGTYDPKLANYVNNSIKQVNVKRNYFDETIFCFCFLDHRCNGSSALSYSTILLFTTTFLIIFSLIRQN